MPRCFLYQAPSALGSLAVKKMPPMPVTRRIQASDFGSRSFCCRSLPLGFQVVGGRDRAGAGVVLAGARQLDHLPDVAEIVERPFIQHLRERDLAILLVEGGARAGIGREIAKKRDILLSLLLESIECLFRIGIAIEV